MSNIYETIFLLRQDLPDSKVKGFTAEVEDLIAGGNGVNEKKELWGLRELAYPIHKANKAYYVMLIHSSPPEMTKKIEHYMRNNEQVIRFLTTKIDSVPSDSSPILKADDTEDDNLQEK